MKTYDFTLPWAPSINGYRAVARNRLITTKRGREYKARAFAELDLQGLTHEELDCRISLSLVLNPPTLAKYDADNYCKAILDALTDAGFWLDDEQVDRLLITKGEKVKGGRVDVMVACYE